MARGLGVAAAAVLVACGDDGRAPAGVPLAGEPAPSVGGVWASGNGDDSPVLYIAEDGDLRFLSQDSSFGAGTVTMDGSGQLSGSLRRVLRVGLPSPPPSVPSLPLPPGTTGFVTTLLGIEEQTCSLSGSVSTRVSMSATFTCLSPRGATTTQTYAFYYVAPAHLGPSTPGGLAGNYTLEFSPAGNVLNVNGNGDVFAIYDNGAQCTVNGRFSVLDARFNLYRGEWTFAACTGSRLRSLEGVTFTGFAQRAVGDSSPNGIYVLLTGPVEGRLSLISLIYVPT